MARFALSAFADEAGSSIEEQISALVDNGIGYIEPRNISSKPILTLTDEELFEIKAKLDAAGIKVGSLGSPIGKYPIDKDFEPHIEDFRRALRVCEILDTKNIRMFSFFVEQDDIDTYRDEVIRRLRVLTDMAKEKGIRLCHENETKIYGQMPKEVDELLKANSDLYGIFDPANYRMNDADIIEGINATFNRFAYMHIKDAIYASQSIVPAGEGEGRIPEVINMINEHTDELVYLTLEPHLHIFDAYKGIDDHELKGTHTFNNSREAFDFAVAALTDILKNNGYKRSCDNTWIK